MLDAIRTVLLVEVKDGFGVAPGTVVMAASLQVGAQLLMVVYLSVVNNAQTVVLVADGLVAGFKVNDAQPAHGEANIAVNEEAVVVWPAVHDLGIHRCQRVAFRMPSRIGIKDAADSAHDF
jgi:hypothetical protein